MQSDKLFFFSSLWSTIESKQTNRVGVLVWMLINMFFFVRNKHSIRINKIILHTLKLQGYQPVFYKQGCFFL
jgi:hypothetical protein